MNKTITHEDYDIHFFCGEMKLIHRLKMSLAIIFNIPLYLKEATYWEAILKEKENKEEVKYA